MLHIIKRCQNTLTSPTKLFTYNSCCFLISALISLLKVSNFVLGVNYQIRVVKIPYFLEIDVDKIMEGF